VYSKASDPEALPVAAPRVVAAAGPEPRPAEEPASRPRAAVVPLPQAPKPAPSAKPAPAPAPPKAEERLPHRVLFATGSAAIGPQYRSTLDAAAAWLAAHPDVVALVVEGHASPPGSPAANLALSRRRAEAVMYALMARGVPAARLEARGLGQSAPPAAGVTGQRVELRALYR
jgi:outer membrane protein OmpA-like peptidoglycan-associated protein